MHWREAAMAIIDVLESLDLGSVDGAKLKSLREILVKELGEVTQHGELLSDSIKKIDLRLGELDPGYKPGD
jgi:hypothetical protein